MFGPIRKDAALFRSVRVDEELGTIVWPNGADIDPDVLILGRRRPWGRPTADPALDSGDFGEA